MSRSHRGEIKRSLEFCHRELVQSSLTRCRKELSAQSSSLSDKSHHFVSGSSFRLGRLHSPELSDRNPLHISRKSKIAAGLASSLLASPTVTPSVRHQSEPLFDGEENPQQAELNLPVSSYHGKPMSKHTGVACWEAASPDISEVKARTQPSRRAPSARLRLDRLPRSWERRATGAMTHRAWCRITHGFTPSLILVHT
ncbi:hypothetical protein EYF80_054198 [Liparis tanakae]|uniref:Uncharacterized protein n=1 Tax=Liparis tanakae TaxID=230148 RepID=A0A4Z2F428_9TELE|nr:hypothetical protein EYF80_054198 [Liparis tanakae]